MMHRVGRLGGLALLALALPAVAAAPVLSGLYRVGELGVVDFSIQEGRVVGKLKAQGACAISPDVQVVGGAFEGSVFVGEVLLCQEGPSCGAEKKYPVLAVWRDNAVLGNVKLDTGCTSAALSARTLKISPASVEEKRKILEGVSGSAAAVAQKNAGKKGNTDAQADEALEAGYKAMASGDFALARDAFGRAVSYDDTKWGAHFGLGVARLKLGDPSGALEALDRAQAIGLRGNLESQLLTQIEYNQACAQLALGRKKEALGTLRTMGKQGVSADILDALDHDPDLAGLRSEVDFRRIVADMRLAREKARKQK